MQSRRTVWPLGCFEGTATLWEQSGNDRGLVYVVWHQAQSDAFITFRTRRAADAPMRPICGLTRLKAWSADERAGMVAPISVVGY